MKEYKEEEKQKYCKGFKNCTLTITEYAEKMRINVDDLKQWLKDYKEPSEFGKINVSDIVNTNLNSSTKSSTIKFESETIKLELKENYDKVFLSKLLEVIIYAK